MTIIKGLYTLTYTAMQNQKSGVTHNEFSLFANLSCKEYVILTGLKMKLCRLMLHKCNFDCYVDISD